VILPNNHPYYDSVYDKEQKVTNHTFQGLFLKYYSTIGSNGGYV
jgi:hypothetical protein